MTHHRWRSNEDIDTRACSPKDVCLDCGARRYTPPGFPCAEELNAKAEESCPGPKED